MDDLKLMVTQMMLGKLEWVTREKRDTNDVGKGEVAEVRVHILHV